MLAQPRLIIFCCIPNGLGATSLVFSITPVGFVGSLFRLNVFRETCWLQMVLRHCPKPAEGHQA